MRFRFRRFPAIAAILLGTFLSGVSRADEPGPLAISGRYPHLAMMNTQGECGTGAVVPWADRLWVITYAPHMPAGSDDKLYEIDSDLFRLTRPESVGGTPADRLIHRESNQLIIGPYFIDAQRNVRAVTPKQMPGRLTAVARDLADPANKVYFYDMEGALYEVDVHTLAVAKITGRASVGHHGKGAYSGQNRLVIANNGNSAVNKLAPTVDDPEYANDPEASGSLTEWDGKTWHILERRQFMDITGPGGIDGSPDASSPLWALGWDKRSVILKLLDAGMWHSYRLPVADYSYVAKHGWYTEWPRIREVTGGHLLMNMHGGWFEFPKSFSAANTGGIVPLGSYLKITGDFAPWKNQIVFGCDDASVMANPLASQSCSNLWFTTWENLATHGRPAGCGGPWLADAVKAGVPSEPYLIGGYRQRMVHLAQTSDAPLKFTLETDADGRGHWAEYQTIEVPPHGYVWHVFPENLAAQWIRVKTDRDCENTTAYFHYRPGGGATTDRAMFTSLADVDAKEPWHAGAVRPLGANSGMLWCKSTAVDGAGRIGAPAELLVGSDMRFQSYSGAPVVEPRSIGTADGYKVQLDDASIIVTDAKGRYRLPISSTYDHAGLTPRLLREVVTERFLLNAGGSFFMVPYPTAGGASRIKPVCTHDKRLTDFCSWRGLTVLAGTRDDAKPDGHFFGSSDGTAGLWFGDIDDLWKMGKPRGHGGPWLHTPIAAGAVSDPFLMAGYDRKSLALSHDAPGPAKFTIEVDFAASGFWHTFQIFDVPAGQTVKFEFPEGYSAQWIRARCDKACRATMQLTYN